MTEHPSRKTVWYGVGNALKELGPAAWEARAKKLLEEKIIPKASPQWQARLEKHKNAIAKTTGWVATAAEVGIVAGVTYGGVKLIKKIVGHIPVADRVPGAQNILQEPLKPFVPHVTRKGHIRRYQGPTVRLQDYPLAMRTTIKRNKLHEQLQHMKNKQPPVPSDIPPFLRTMLDTRAAAKWSEVTAKKIPLKNKGSWWKERIDAGLSVSVLEDIANPKPIALAPEVRKTQQYAAQAEMMWQKRLDTMNADHARRLAEGITRGNATRLAREAQEESARLATELIHQSKIRKIDAVARRTKDLVTDVVENVADRARTQRLLHAIELAAESAHDPRSVIARAFDQANVPYVYDEAQRWFGDVLINIQTLHHDRRYHGQISRLLGEIQAAPNNSSAMQAAEKLLQFGYEKLPKNVKTLLLQEITDRRPNFIAKAREWLQTLHAAGADIL